MIETSIMTQNVCFPKCWSFRYIVYIMPSKCFICKICLFGGNNANSKMFIAMQYINDISVTLTFSTTNVLSNKRGFYHDFDFFNFLTFLIFLDPPMGGQTNFLCKIMIIFMISTYSHKFWGGQTQNPYSFTLPTRELKKGYQIAPTLIVPGTLFVDFFFIFLTKYFKSSGKNH